MTSPLLSPAMLKVLTIMVRDDEELVGDKGQWWVGDHRTNAQTVYRLLKLCVIKEVNIPSGCDLFVANEEASKLLDDPTYVPLILQHIQQQ